MAWNQTFFRSFLILSGSNLAAQLINLLTYIILPKYFYMPEAFGLFGLFLALYYILFELINLKMDQSVMLPAEDREAGGLLGLSWAIAMVGSALIFAILLLVQWASDRIPFSFALLLGGALLTGGLMQPAMVWLNRKGAYYRMGQVRLVQAVATFGGSVLGYYQTDGSATGLLIGFLAGMAAGAIVAVLPVLRHGWQIAGRSTIAKYQSFMRYGSISAMISTLSKNLPAFAIRSAFGDAALGWYTLASKYLNAPVGIFSASLGQVYYKEVSQAEPERIRQLTVDITRRILWLTAIPVAVFLIFGGDIFQGVFGPQWRPAGTMFQVMVGWYFIAYASGPVSMLLDVRLKLRWELYYNLALLAGRAAALLSALWIGNVFVVIALYSAVGIIFNLYLLRYILNLSKSHEPGA